MGEGVGIMNNGLPDNYDKMNVSAKRFIGHNDGYESDRMSKSSPSNRIGRKIVDERVEHYRNSLMNERGPWVNGGYAVQEQALDELRKAKVAKGFEKLSLYNENENYMEEQINRVVNGRDGDRSEMEEYLRAQRMAAQGMRYANSVVSEDDGFSNHLSRSSHRHGYQMRNMNDVDSYSNIDSVADDRSEYLSRFDGMRDRPSQYDYIIPKGKEKAYINSRMTQNSYSGLGYSDRYLEMNGPSMQPSYPNAQFSRPTYLNKHIESPLLHKEEFGGSGFNHHRYPSSRAQQYENPLGPQTFRRVPFHKPAQYPESPTRSYCSETHGNDDMTYLDPNAPRPRKDEWHLPSCSCFQCSKLRPFIPPVQRSPFNDKLSDVSVDAMCNRQEFGPRDYGFRTTNVPPLRSRDHQSHASWPSDINSEVDCFAHRRSPVEPLPSVGLHCLPVAGGSPFISCFNCFEVLLLPKTVSNKIECLKKIKCGACSTVVVFTFSNQRLVFGADFEAMGIAKVDGNINLSSTREELCNKSPTNQGRETFSSVGYDTIGCESKSMNREQEQKPSAQDRVNSSSVTYHHYSLSTQTIDMEGETASDTESDSEEMNFHRGDSTVAKEASKLKEAPPPAGSSLQEYFEYSNTFHVVNGGGEQNTIGHSKQKKSLPSKSGAPQIPMDYMSSASETDMSSTDFSNTGTSFDSHDASRKGRKSEIFFAGIVKRSYKNKLNQIIEQEKANVTVNGHLITNQIVKKVEKVAGVIYPGNYWYDYQAGFWGEIGGPCLGIIPPFIEELKFPLPDKCAGGNTSVFVNGRELNQKDMDLLRRRGLPAERNRSYTVELSGRIIDKDTGAELKSLGKLAPTVERLQHGFGMRVPKTAS